MSKSSLTNGLLAVIAFCLILLTGAQLGLIPAAHAGTHPLPTAPPTEVVIVGVRGPSTGDRTFYGILPVNLGQIGGKALPNPPAIPVKTAP